MKKNRWIGIIWVGTVLLILTKVSLAIDVYTAESQYLQNKIPTAAAKILCSKNLHCGSRLVADFYTKHGFIPVWTTTDGDLSANAKDLLSVIHNAYQDGLNPEDYHTKVIDAMLPTLNQGVSSDNPDAVARLANFDLTLTDAFFLYASDILYGKVNNKVSYPNWTITKRSADLVAVLDKALQAKQVHEALADLSPHSYAYTKLKAKLAQYQLIAGNGGWKQIPSGDKLEVGSQGDSVALLQQRLMATGELSSIADDKKGIFDVNLESAVSKFQEDHGLNDDGVVGTETLSALNLPVTTRIQQIELNLDRLRWLPDDLGKNYIVVNIPDFSLMVVQDGKVIMTMPVIVGADGKQSCVLSSKITYLELNPYWYVPRSIAVKEFLPILKRNPQFLEQNAIQVYSGGYADTDEIDQSSINWRQVDPNNFEFQLRQEPGTLNSLGRIKFIFANSCGIYLHDTPAHDLFSESRRDLSHGCIRVGKPIDLAAYLLQDKKTWTNDKISSEIDKGQREIVTLTQPMNIYIVYATAWVDSNNVLQFRNDIYNIDDSSYPIVYPTTSANAD